MQIVRNTLEYKVVINRERQYSLWPAERASPLGWKDVGFLGSRGDCFAFIEKVWVDAAPLKSSQKISAVSRF